MAAEHFCGVDYDAIRAGYATSSLDWLVQLSRAMEPGVAEQRNRAAIAAKDATRKRLSSGRREGATALRRWHKDGMRHSIPTVDSRPPPSTSSQVGRHVATIGAGPRRVPSG